MVSRPVAADGIQTEPLDLSSFTKPPSIIRPLQSALRGCSMTIPLTKWHDSIMHKTNALILGILSWIIWLISIQNWCKWSFVLLRDEQTGLVCTRQQNKEMLETLSGVTHPITISLGCDFLASRGNLRKTLTDERRKKKQHEITLPESTRTDFWGQTSLFFHDSKSAHTPVRYQSKDTKADLLGFRLNWDGVIKSKSRALSVRGEITSGPQGFFLVLFLNCSTTCDH